MIRVFWHSYFKSDIAGRSKGPWRRLRGSFGEFGSIGVEEEEERQRSRHSRMTREEKCSISQRL